MFKYYRDDNLKLIVGSGDSFQKGYISSDIGWLDITNWWHWLRNFRVNSIKNIVAEHVFEHLNKFQILKSLRLMHKFMKTNGKLRIAIPDKNRKDSLYVESVKPPIDGHQSYMNLKDISKLLKDSGFKVQPLEYFDNSGSFKKIDWDEIDGKIKRSFKFDKQTKFKRSNLYYTSLIVDAIKK